MLPIEDFTAHFKKKKQVLYRFFLKMIREKTSYYSNPHPLVRDYMGLTFLIAYKKILKEGEKRPVEKTIMMKARDVFYDSIHEPKKKPRLVDIPPAIYDKASSDPDPYQRLVLKEDMQTVNILLDDASRQLFEKIADQVPRRLIAEDLQTTLNALTTRIYRQRMQLQQHLEKGF